MYNPGRVRRWASPLPTGGKRPPVYIISRVIYSSVSFRVVRVDSRFSGNAACCRERFFSWRVEASLLPPTAAPNLYIDDAVCPCSVFFSFSPTSFTAAVQDALDRANEVMGSSLTQRDVKIHVVRDVAPNKPMLCLSFAAPDAADGGGGGGGGGATKKDRDANTGSAVGPFVRNAGGHSEAASAPAAAAGAGADAVKTTACSGSGSEAAAAGDSGTGGAGDAAAAAAAAAPGGTAVIDADGGEGEMGGVEVCKKRPRTAEVAGDRGA